MLELKIISKTDPRLAANMKNHYSNPKGFVGRSICYGIFYNNQYYGSIIGGSATLHLVGRDKFFNFTKPKPLNNIVNNIFYHVEPKDGKYPLRNFTVKILKLFVEKVKSDWEQKYRDKVIGFESLVELPRTGEIYKRCGWTEVGTTKGYTCKRIGGKVDTEKFGGTRIWDTHNLRPKRVFCLKVWS